MASFAEQPLSTILTTKLWKMFPFVIIYPRILPSPLHVEVSHYGILSVTIYSRPRLHIKNQVVNEELTIMATNNQPNLLHWFGSRIKRPNIFVLTLDSAQNVLWHMLWGQWIKACSQNCLPKCYRGLLTEMMFADVGNCILGYLTNILAQPYHQIVPNSTNNTKSGADYSIRIRDTGGIYIGIHLTFLVLPSTSQIDLIPTATAVMVSVYRSTFS